MNLAQLIDFERLETERERTRVPAIKPVVKARRAAPAQGLRSTWRKASLQTIRDFPASTAAELRERIGKSANDVNTLLHHLVVKGFALRVGGGRPYRYRLTAAGLREC